jgi:long-subunit fatty acid transport protein
LAFAVLCAAAVSSGQEIDDAVVLEDLGFDSHLLSAARPAGLAGAYIAAGNDVHSIVYNPAGLSHLRRIETAMGFEYEKTRVENTFYGSSSGVDHTSTSLDHISLAYPFPTYRGSLVGAFGIYREYSAYLDIINRGLNTDTSTNDDYVLQQSGSIFSYNIGCAIDLSPTISAGIAFFLLDGTINALTQLSYEYLRLLEPEDIRQGFLLDDLEVDADGYGGRIGIQYFPHSKIRFGATVSSPVWISLEGNALQEETYYYDDGTGTFDRTNFAIDIDQKLPYRIDAGVCYTPADFLVACDASYADWSQSSINKVRLRDENLKPVQRKVVDIRIGVEYRLPQAPIWLRAGYAYLPYALNYLQADRIDGTKLTRASIDKERQLYSFGIGGLAGRVLSLDAAYQYISGERSIPTLDDARVQHRVLLSASYRF